MHLVLVQVTLSLKANLARLAWSYLIVSVLKRSAIMVIFYTAFNQVILNFRIRFFNPLSAFSSLQKIHFVL